MLNVKENYACMRPSVLYLYTTEVKRDVFHHETALISSEPRKVILSAGMVVSRKRIQKAIISIC